MKKFFLFEIKYWVKQPMTWIFLLIYAIFVFAALVSDAVQLGGGNGNTHKNAPLAIQSMFAFLSLIGVVMNTSFFNATATRDYTYGMDQIIFSSPIRKFDFFFGKFLGAFVAALIPYLGITLAALVAPYWPGVDPLRFGPFVGGAHRYGFLLFGFFNTLFGGALIYSFALKFRNPVIAYLSSFGIIIFYIISTNFTSDIENQTLAIFTDPLGLNALDLYTKYWTPAQRNTSFIGFEGIFIVSRVFWAVISMGVLGLMYYFFDFTQSKTNAGKKKQEPKEVYSGGIGIPVVVPGKSPVMAWYRQFVFELRAIVKNNSFIILTSIGLMILVVNLFFNSNNYGEKSLPVTYNVAGEIRNALSIFLRGFIIFYSGYIVFRERDVKFNEIADATPVRSGSIATSKLAAILVALAVVLGVAILIGMLSQLFRGYTNLEPGVYLGYAVLELLRLSFILVMAYLIQVLINNKYLAYFAIVVFLVVNTFLWQALKVESNLVVFGALPGIIYSDMNGFGPFVPGVLAFGLYWSLFCSLLILLIIGMSLRGKEVSFQKRLHQLGKYLRANALISTILLVSFAGCAVWLYYNTKVLNSYISSKETEQRQVDYEKKYKKFENNLLPFTTSLDYTINLFPEERSMDVEVKWWVKNVHTTPIKELHYSLPDKAKNIRFTIPGGKIIGEDKRLMYNIYKLETPLLPGDSLPLSFAADFISKGIENEVSFTGLTSNGSFFHDNDILPAIGYNADFEISDKNDRRKYKLPLKSRMPKLTRNCGDVCNTSYISNSSAWVNLHTTISTSGSQIAIAPGTLTKEWKQDGRNYFTYDLKHKALNFFSFLAAEYEVARDTINGINIEVYYDKKHPYNVARMTEAMKKALKYYTENFGPYYQEQCRIIEFPRYAGFAQAFPGTMPYSESIGFITDLRDPKSIDMVTYVVAHEMGHQWWAHQVIGPRMQGSEMFSEGLSQYSSLMVMEHAFGKEMVSRFLKYELNNYLRARGVEREYENPLMRTEQQQYIHYNKASLVFYYMKEMIGEQQFNQSLRNIVTKYAYKPAPFPTAFNIVDEFRAVTPDSLQYLLKDMFETITLFNNKLEKVTVTPTADKQFKVDLLVQCEKLRADSLGNEKAIPLNDYIDIGMFAKNANNADELGKPLLYQRIKISKKQTALSFIVKEKPYQVGVDPYHYLIDKVIEDNLKKVD